MTKTLAVGDQAPNFDLTSTEGVVLMLHDEVPRMEVLLYFFEDPEAAATNLEALSQNSATLGGHGIKVMAVSTASLEELRATQWQLELPYPLLHDDRELSKAYWAESGKPAVLVLVDRNQQIVWVEREQPEFGNSLASLLAGGSRIQKSTANYPKSVINRLVDMWVN